MLHFRWRYALPLFLAVSLCSTSARASAIRDRAGLFSSDAVSRAQATLDRIERDSQISVVIETIDSLQGQTPNDAAIEHARQSGIQGIFVLIAKQEHKTHAEVSRSFQQAISVARRDAIVNSFTPDFKRGDFDGGLNAGVNKIAAEVAAAKAENGGRLRAAAPPVGVRRGPVAVRRGNGGGFGVGTLLMIGLGVLAILFVLRMLGGLFGGGAGVGRPGMGGYGGGYGGGGGGGGFFSGLMGGIGGALAGNWLYDQFSGRHHGGGSADQTSYGDSTQQPDAGGSDWAGSSDNAGDWGGGGDAGGGGGDWGGGGGGGDWGGGGGGGDW